MNASDPLADIPASPGSSPPATPGDLINILKLLDISHVIHRHAPIFTVAEGEPLKKSIPGLHCRNLFVRDRKERMFLVVAANETAVDLRRLQEVLGCERLSFGSPERLWRTLGVRPGSVCPFALINDRVRREVTPVLDAFMMEAPHVVYHPLDNAMSVGVSPADLLKFIAWCGHVPRTVDFSAPGPAGSLNRPV